MDGKETAKARLVAKGYQDPDPRDGNVDTACCVSRSSSHLPMMSWIAAKRWKNYNLETRRAFLRADGLGRGVCLRAPDEWDSKDNRRTWKLRAPAYGLTDPPVAPRRSFRTYSANSADLPSKIGLEFEVSSSDPCLFRVLGQLGGLSGPSPRILPLL